MNSTSDVKCPYCGTLNPANNEKCSCGFDFVQANRNKAMQNEKVMTNSPNHTFVGILIFIFTLTGILGILTSIIQFATNLIFGLTLLAAGLIQLGLAEVFKILIQIEKNTRNK
jgi:hypothetical protein